MKQRGEWGGRGDRPRERVRGAGAWGGGRREGTARYPRQLTNKLTKTRNESDVAQRTKSGHR